MYIPNILRPYWMLRVASVLLKLAAVVIFMLFCGQLFQVFSLKLGMTPNPNSLSGSEFVQIFYSTNALIDFIVRYVSLMVGVYASGQLIDLFISIEESLRTLANRRRQRIEVSREE